jgi:crotonobetainyl-CoA:carnitine CoA-transferase CaiB-like acyl-CoA transferase
LTVLDLSRVLAGPWCGQILADLGADVIKVERPGAGDDTRGWGPPFLRDTGGHDTADAAYYLCANRNKRSLTVDFTTAEGQAIIKSLARQSDVVLENFKVGGLAAYGLDYRSLRADHPELVYCSITGFGQTGPYAPRAGYDLLVQAMGGMMSITGRSDDEPGGGPQRAGVAVTDLFTGFYATIGILAALAHRDRTGIGQQIDIGLFDVQVACLANQAMNYLVSGAAPRRHGNAHPNLVPYQDFPTSDGHVLAAVGNDGQFARFCAVLGLPELAGDPRFTANKDRVTNRAELIPMLSAVTVANTTAHWAAALERVGVPAGPINTIDAVFADPQVRARHMRIDLPHPAAGSVPLVASPLNLSETPVSYRRAPPTLGADSAVILRERLGMSDAAIETLKAKGIV